MSTQAHPREERAAEISISLVSARLIKVSMRDGGGRGAALANLVLGSERGRVADAKNRGGLPGAKMFEEDNARKQRTMGLTMTGRAATRSHFDIG